MAGVYCERCQCSVMVEQDGKSCSNCGMVLVGPDAGKKPAQAKRKSHAPDETLPAPRDVIASQEEATEAAQVTTNEAREAATEAADFQRTQQPKKQAAKE